MGFCRFWKPCRDTWGNYRPAWISRSLAQLPAQDESTPWSKQENAGSIVDHAHRCTKDGEPEPQPLLQQRTDGCREQPSSQSA